MLSSFWTGAYIGFRHVKGLLFCVFVWLRICLLWVCLLGGLLGVGGVLLLRLLVSDGLCGFDLLVLRCGLVTCSILVVLFAVCLLISCFRVGAVLLLASGFEYLRCLVALIVLVIIVLW